MLDETLYPTQTQVSKLLDQSGLKRKLNSIQRLLNKKEMPTSMKTDYFRTMEHWNIGTMEH